MTRFVVCGEALIDLVEVSDGAATSFSTSWAALSAGGPMNSAIALSRLGAQVEFLGRLGSDRFAQQLRSHLVGSNVGLNLAVDSDQATSLAVVSLDDAGKASYVFHFAETANFGWRPDELPHLAEGDWLHFGSLVLVVQPGAAALLDWVAKSRANMSVDLNVRPAVLPDPVAYWKAIEGWLVLVGRSGGVIKASDDDIRFLAEGSGASGTPLEVAAAWARDYGAAMVVVTLGAEGAAAVFEDGSVIRVAGRSVKVVDTVGAGDTFMAGFLEAYAADPLDVKAALTRGVGASAIVCMRRGADAPTAAELDNFLAAV